MDRKELYLLLDVSKHLKLIQKQIHECLHTNLTFFIPLLSEGIVCLLGHNLIVTLEKFSPWPRGQYITKTCQFYIEIALHTCKVSFHCCWQSRVSLVVSLLKYTFYLWLLLRSSVGLCWSTVSLNESRYRFIFGILLGNAGLHEYLDWSFSSLQMLPLTHSLTLVTTLLCC